ncbi:MAG: hypothetical protein JSV12_07315 [Candidatus Bathyarchaeota archaeon]|nr:MAG: hypothetical protein JSV12_07315 [Candidatus Bathyarchaeota archaeon]
MSRHTHFEPYSVSYDEVVGFVEENECVANWLKKYSSAPHSEKKLSGSRLNKASVLCRFFKWLRIRKSINLRPKEFLNRQLRFRQSIEHLDGNKISRKQERQRS